MLSLSSLSSLSTLSVLPLIYIDNELDSFLKYIKGTFSDVKGHEFEIRFSKTGTNTISEIVYNMLLQKCIKNYKIKQEDLKYKSSIVKFYKMTKGGLVTEYRKIESKGQSICQIKNGKDNRDRSYHLGKSGDSYTIRYSSSVEQNMDCPGEDVVKEKTDVKIRKRNRFEYDTGKGYIYMFTKIKDGTKSADGKEELIKYEFEIEYDSKQLSQELIQESLWLITDYFQTNLTIDKVDSLLKGPKAIFAQFDKDVRLPKPVNIKLDSYQTFRSNSYTVTNKLDGERFLLFFLNECVYVRQGDKVAYITDCDKEFDNTLIDAEFFKGQFYFFDCYIFKNRPLQHELLDRRLECAKEVAKTNPALFVMKIFYKNLYKDTETLLETLSKEDNDGLIYTPQQIAPNQPVFKWKFPEKMSIDFRIIEAGQDGAKYKYYLCVYTPRDQKGETMFEIDGRSAIYLSDTELANKTIYEFMYDKTAKKFVLHRPRPDKDRPNFVNVAIDVFKDMVHPFESYKLLELFKPMFKFRKYHNQIKREIIQHFCGNKTVLDLGIGRGGDIDKYKQAGTKKVFGVEPNSTNYGELLERFPEYVENVDTPKYCAVHTDLIATHFCQACPVNYFCTQCDIDAHTYAKTRQHVRERINKDRFVELIKTKAQNTAQIVEKVGVKCAEGVDVVASFFSLSFFFFPDKPDDLQKLVQTISQNLKEGGHFIGTTIDGDKTKALLNGLPNKTFNFGDGSIKLNADETVLFEIKGTIVETQLESLVNCERLLNELRDVGIEYLGEDNYSHFFNGNKELSRDENTLNSLYRTFVFRKHRLSAEIRELCSTKKVSDLLTRTEDNRCVDLFYKLFEKKVDMFNVPPEHTYDALKEFMFTKRFINPIDSPHLIKTVAITGERLHKVVFRQKIPTTAVLLSDYTTVENKKNYPILREQILKTLEILKQASIDYGNLTPKGLLVSEESDGNIRVLFYDYSRTRHTHTQTHTYTDYDEHKWIWYTRTYTDAHRWEGLKVKDQENLPALLEFLTK